MSASISPTSSSSTAVATPPLTTGGPADERDVFLSWLRGEFAAANAIIDLFLTHMRATGGQGEYDHVMSAVHQRRGHWAPILHLQQYYPVADIAIALQQVTWIRQQGDGQPQMSPSFRQQHPNPHAMHRGGRRFGYGNDHGSGYSNGSGYNNNRRNYTRSLSDFGSTRENSIYNSEEGSENVREGNSSLKEREREPSEEVGSCKSSITDKDNACHKDGTSETVPENDSTVSSFSEEKKMLPKEFVSNELLDGKTFNAYEGLKVYEEIIDISDVENMLAWVHETRAAGRRGELQGQTFIAAKRPSKGHGREVIQLGFPIVEGPPDDENTPALSPERKVEAVPVVVRDMLNKLGQVVTSKPDYCVIDFFNENDHSLPNMWPNWYGKPVYTVCLTECDMIFGRHISTDPRGDHRGHLELSLPPGSLVVVRNRGADLAKRAIPSRRKNRVLLSFGKAQPRRYNNYNNYNHNPSIPSITFPSNPSPPVPWGPQARPTVQHVLVPPTSVVTAVATVPIAVPVPVSVPVQVAVPVTPRLVISGTGVFLPPGSQPPPPPSLTQGNSGESENPNPNGPELANGVVGSEDESIEGNKE